MVVAGFTQYVDGEPELRYSASHSEGREREAEGRIFIA